MRRQSGLQRPAEQVYRTATLVRSLAFSLRYDVSIAEHWKPHAQALLNAPAPLG